MLELLIKILLAYALGNVLGGDVLGRFRRVDLRSEGSGNVGATNAFRSQGALFAVGVLLIDIVKAVIAVWLVPLLPWFGGDAMSTAPDSNLTVWLSVACGAAVILGHCYPVLHGFKGGKGVACMVGVVLGLVPALFPWLILVWVLLLVLTGYVSLASIVAVAVLLLLVIGHGLSLPIVVFVAALLAFIVFTHRSNVGRLLAGNESRFAKVMVVHRWLKIGPYKS